MRQPGHHLNYHERNHRSPAERPDEQRPLAEVKHERHARLGLIKRREREVQGLESSLAGLQRRQQRTKRNRRSESGQNRNPVRASTGQHKARLRRLRKGIKSQRKRIEELGKIIATREQIEAGSQPTSQT